MWRYEFLNSMGTNCPIKVSGHYNLHSLKEISTQNFVQLRKGYLSFILPLNLDKDLPYPLGLLGKIYSIESDDVDIPSMEFTPMSTSSLIDTLSWYILSLHPILVHATLQVF